MRRFLPLLKLAVVAVGIAGAVYWFRFKPVPVLPHPVQRGTMVEEVMGTGTLEARVSTTISPKISGRIETLLADQGDRVSAGDELVRLDNRDLEQQVAIAVANVEAAKAAIERLKADKERAAVVLTQAEKNYQRIEQLAKRDATSQGDLDQSAEGLGVAVADVSRAEAGINEGQKGLVSAQKNLQYQQARLSDTVIVAPFDGMIVKRNREPGDVVVPGSSILTLISTEELWIRAWVDETQMSKLDSGQAGRVVFRSEPEQSYSAEVARLGREADRETREFIVDVRVLELPRNWAVGQRAEAFITVAEPQEVPLVPKSFLVRREGRDGVFVDDNSTATWRAVTLGSDTADAIGIIQGLEVGEVIVKPVSPSGSLADGRKVVIQ
ncbi:efflux RND transporter periplasmic adaptor subunit [Rhodopirellula sp. P2]|uniref:efflux RND transporter periplasmic adaptor subunit n=1 Tax=Rhodopirellula sp. P2 TaxID=2127060 RepID=UPI002367AFDE|nr:efflux RND transporter periplasmic adaptor subunit [Rhodopirellula sp. P2]WDQ17139.1 efflux RND transporter periplasmic adaptor subunit [Rhodopirellula sp. P2]